VGGAVGRAGGPIERGLQSDTDSARIDACIRAGDSRDLRYAPLLIELLDVPSADVRFYAICALERVTGCSYPYCYHGPAAEVAADARLVRGQWLQRRRGGAGG
jgi:hypothetical protein